MGCNGLCQQVKPSYAGRDWTDVRGFHGPCCMLMCSLEGRGANGKDQGLSDHWPPGGPCDAAENSPASFQRARELGLTHIKCDLQLSRDEHVVLMHDSTVDRTTNGSGRVSDLTLGEIREARLPLMVSPPVRGGVGAHVAGTARRCRGRIHRQID